MIAETRIEHGYTDPHTGQVYGPVLMDFRDSTTEEQYARQRAEGIGGTYVRRTVETITTEWKPS